MVESSSFAGHMANVILGLVLLLIAFCSIVPMWHVLMASISEGRDLFAKDGLVLLPVGGLNFEGYKLVFSDPSILRSYAVTVFYVVGTAGLGLLLNVLGGYVLSQNSRLKPFFVAMLMFSMMFSGGLIPSYIVNSRLGLVGSPLAIITWNAWFEASIYLPRQRKWWPLQLLIRDLTAKNQDFLNYANPDYNRYLIQYVVIVIATLPVLLTFPFFQKRLEENMVVGAVKG